jgi:DNA mismatch endonuclease (patch repair protein)
VGLFVFIDGCFWHGCQDHYQAPKTNAAFWAEKVRGNRRRDQETTERLQEAGFAVARFWEHQDPRDIAAATAALYLRLVRRFDAV